MGHTIKKHYPDIRKTINEVQKYCINGVLTIPDISKVDNFVDRILELLFKKKEIEIRKYIIENETDFKGDYSLLMKGLFDAVCDIQTNNTFTEAKKKMWLVAIGEYMYKSAFVVDQEINFYCLILALGGIFEN